MSEAYERWGDALLARAEEQPAREAEATRRQGRLQLRHAGRVSRRLAELESATRQFTDHLWKSANAYLRGQDFDNAVRGFEKYVENESQRRPRALVSLGEALLSLGRIDEALAAFGECIEYHGRDAAAFRARLLASRAYVEKGELLQAEALLRANLSEQYQTPASAEWRDSLFALGEVLHVQGRYAEAIRSLEEAVARYPQDPQSLAAQYRIACCHRQGAEDATKQLERELKGTDQVVYSRQIDASRTEALRQYRRVREVLSELGEGRELLPAEEAMLRNCYFAIGDVLYALRQYDAAVEAYRTLTNRYQDRPEVLEAYVRMAWTFRRLNRPLEARTSLEQAKVMLAGMKEDALFQETTNYSRGQWGERLDRLSNL
jgi:tetratricopeptide (TPR) repeat protein